MIIIIFKLFFLNTNFKKKVIYIIIIFMILIIKVENQFSILYI